MTTLKTLTIVAALLAGGTSLALAQNGPPTGGDPSVAGGANGNPAVPGPGFSGYYLGAPGYLAQQPGYVDEPGTAAPRRVTNTHHRSMYMYAPARGNGTHTHKKSALKPGLTNGGY